MNSRNIIDGALEQAMPFGKLSQPSFAPPEMAQPTQPKPSFLDRIQNHPVMMNALGRMGAAILIANSKGAGFGGSLGHGMNAFNDTMDNQVDQRLKAAQAGYYEQKADPNAAYGVQSGGFEGDMARAMYVLQSPDASTQDKARAQAVIETAQRLQGSWDPVTGDYRWNERSRLPRQTPISTPQSSETLAPPTVRGADGVAPSTATLPPPSFAGTGNRKVDAALQQRAGESAIDLRLEKEKKNLEQQSKADESAANAEYMLSELKSGKDALDNFDTGYFAPLRGAANQAAAEFGVQGAEKKAQAFETINRVSKKLGAEGLKAFGGSDTERELIVAIETSVDAKNRPETNRQIFEKQIAAMEILAKRPEFLALYGGDSSNPAFKRQWRDYQRAQFLRAEQTKPEGAPAGVKAEEWSAMTPEERALWK